MQFPYTGTIEVDIEELAYSLNHEQASETIKKIDEVVCDLDFTLKLTKDFIETVINENDHQYTYDLMTFMKRQLKTFEEENES
jgi:paraquat-inducible protein B